MNINIILQFPGQMVTKTEIPTFEQNTDPGINISALKIATQAIYLEIFTPPQVSLEHTWMTVSCEEKLFYETTHTEAVSFITSTELNFFRLGYTPRSTAQLTLTIDLNNTTCSPKNLSDSPFNLSVDYYTNGLCSKTLYLYSSVVIEEVYDRNTRTLTIIPGNWVLDIK